jgi:hypothetical protein
LFLFDDLKKKKEQKKIKFVVCFSGSVSVAAAFFECPVK